MGLCASGQSRNTEYQNPFDLRITTALQKYKSPIESIPKSERVKSFNQVLTRSGKIRKSLLHVKTVFKRFDADGSNSIDHSELMEALKVLGNDVSADDVEKVFHEADIYANNKLSEKEFIVCLVLGYVLGQLKLSTAEDDAAGTTESGSSNEDGFDGQSEKLKWAFNNMIGTYLLFDVDASGDLSREEVMGQLHARKGVFADSAARTMMSEERWNELDWDGDGQISFREFIWAFQSWISVDGEELEENSERREC
jgi:calcium-binding protein CML